MFQSVNKAMNEVEAQFGVVVVVAVVADLQNLRPQHANPRSLVCWSETRWNTKVDAMSRVLELSSAINFVMDEHVQKPYRLKDEEIRSMEKVQPFLEPFCQVTERLQKDDATPVLQAFREVCSLRAHILF